MKKFSFYNLNKTINNLSFVKVVSIFVFAQVYLLFLEYFNKRAGMSVSGDVLWYNFWTLGIFRNGYIPYVDTVFPYPPLALFFFLIPGLIAYCLTQNQVIHLPTNENLTNIRNTRQFFVAFNNGANYTFAWIILILILSWVLFIVALKYLKNYKFIIVFYSIFLFCVGTIFVSRTEVLMTPFFVIGVLLFLQNRKRIIVPTILVSIGVLIKIVPIVGLVLIFFLTDLKGKIKVVITGLLTATLSFFLIYFVAHIPISDQFTFLGPETARGVDTFSVLAIPFYFIYHIKPWGINFSNYNQNLNLVTIRDSMWTGFSTHLFAYLELVLIIIIILLLILKIKKHKYVSDDFALQILFAFVLVLLTVNKTGSIQFIAWLIPVSLIAISVFKLKNEFWNKNIKYTCFLLLLSQIFYPYIYFTIQNPTSWCVPLFLIIKYGLLVYMLVKTLSIIIKDIRTN
jgi:hypothetical protein